MNKTQEIYFSLLFQKELSFLFPQELSRFFWIHNTTLELCKVILATDKLR